jgi:hypothetical protein
MRLHLDRRLRSVRLELARHSVEVAWARRWWWRAGYTDWGYRDERPRAIYLGPLRVQWTRWHPEGCGCRHCILSAEFMMALDTGEGPPPGLPMPPSPSP